MKRERERDIGQMDEPKNVGLFREESYGTK